MKKLLLFIILSINLFGYSPNKIEKDLDKLFSIVYQEQPIEIGGQLCHIDMRRLLWLTSGMESNFGRDEHHGRIAKTYFQFEKDSAEYYLSKQPQMVNYIEGCLHRKLDVTRNEDAVYIAFIFYMSKIQVHRKWIEKYKYMLYQTNDLEWYFYKLLFNSTKGKATYIQWKYREKLWNKMLNY